MDPNNLKYFSCAEVDGGRLRPHQAEGVALMATTPKTLCADPVGAGKTVQAAGLIAHLAETGEVSSDHPALVLTMGSQLAHQTATELSRFLPALTVLGLAGHRGLASSASERRRWETLNRPAHVKVMTYSQWRTRRQLWEGPVPSVLVLDEVSALKGGGADYEAVMSIASDATRVHMFSATPYENDPVEMWLIYSLLHLPDLPTLADFENYYVAWREYDNRRQPVGWATDLAAEYFRQLTAPHFFRWEEAVADLKRPTYARADRWVPLSPGQARLMAAADRNDGLKRHQAQKAIVTGAVSGLSARALEAARLVAEIVDRDPTGKVLIIAESLTELDLIASDLTKAGIGWTEVRGETKQTDRADVVERYRSDSELRVLLGSKVLERGLNLQFCRYLITVGLPDNPARLEQQIGRIVRHGSPFYAVEHYVVLTECAYDRSAARRVLRKEEHAAMVITATP
ncbi:helicase-related protein [Geodermatophilus sp. SYSU D01105]